MAYLNPNSFYGAMRKGYHYQAPRSSAFGLSGSAPAPKPPSSAAPAAASGGGSGAPTAPQGFTVQQSTLPPDPVYSATMSGLTTGHANTIAGLKNERKIGLAAYGYTEDPTTGALTFDPNNPYSQAALALKHYQEAQAGNTNSYAAAGQLYAGSLQNAQNAATSSYGAENFRILNAAQGFLAGNTTAQNNADSEYNTGAATALGNSVANAPNNPLAQAFGAGQTGGATVSTDANGNMALTAGPGGAALVPQQANSTVKLASGWSIVYGPDGRPIKFIPPGG